MKKLFWILIVGVLAMGCSSKKESETAMEQVVEDFWRSISRMTEGELETIPEGNGQPVVITKTNRRQMGPYPEVFNDSNYIQYAAAEKIGIEPIYDLSNLYKTKRPLVRIESGDYYKVDSLTHSMPYLVPEAANLLQDIGKAFRDSIEKRGGHTSNRVVVTSLLRTPYTVKKLRRVNKNAVDSSTHMFATTFDIAWNRFYCPEPSKSMDEITLKRILGEVLLDKRDEGRCYVKYEQKSPCFHITVRK